MELVPQAHLPLLLLVVYVPGVAQALLPLLPLVVDVPGVAKGFQ